MYRVRIDTKDFNNRKFQLYLKQKKIQTAEHPFSKTGTVTYFAEDQQVLTRMIKSFFDRKLVKEVTGVPVHKLSIRRKINEKHVA